MSPPNNRAPLAQAARERMGHGVKELAEGREEREQERLRADTEAVVRALHEHNAVRLGRTTNEEGQ